MNTSLARHRIGSTGIVGIFLTVTVSALASAQRPSFTIEDALSAPFPTGLVASPAGGRLAWVFDERGSRNVWAAGASPNGSYQARRLTRYAGDEGLEIEDLSWRPDGNGVVFARGGSANPASLPLGLVPTQIWTMTLGDTSPRMLGEGRSPVISPRSNAVVYLARNEIVLQGLDGSKAESLVHERGRDGSLVWSPDGGRLAFVSSRGDHGLVGVYDLSHKTLTWLAPSVDQDASPIWSPDGRRVAFIRIPTGGPGPFSTVRSGQPWSIWVADAVTGRGRAVWMADAGPGSLFHPVEGNAAFAWGAEDHIVFPWERTGWLHLYRISVAGGLAKLLTPGDFEVFSASLSPDRREVVYSSNQGDLDHRHIWTVPVAGGTPVPVTAGSDIADMPVFASDGRTIAFLHSDARNPMRPAIVLRNDVHGAQLQDIASQEIPKTFPTAQLVVPQAIIFRSTDGLMVHGQLFLPPDSPRMSRHPALIFVHGGPYRQMLPGWNPMGAYTDMYAMNQYFASRGYVVLSVNYRGGTGYGMNFRIPPNFGPSGASEFNDVMGGARYLTARSDVDSKRVGIWGASYGGYLTALALARASDTFAAGVDYAGVHDWRPVLSFYASAGARSETDSLAWQASPLASIGKWRSPVLVIQADDDHNVPFDQTVQLMRALRQQRVPSDLIVIPDEIHDLLMHHSWVAYFQAQSDFLDHHLGVTP